ncbi:ribosomal protection-like ABC-F family protein [Lysinibacillus sp. 54212]|uniref:ribosomal protection-like ABC-F family protein n=1 Tax=Lysinibacillus sp. 54212 TaxID=3119829 RepID=UPI002FCB36AE
MKEIMKLHEVTLTFHEVLLFEAKDLTIKEGERIGIVGKNGAGKSTLLEMLAGNMQPTKGQISLLDPALSVAYVKQEESSFGIEELEKEQQEWFSRWNIPIAPYDSLSGGEKLKVRLMRGFHSRAGLLMLDEPTNHLDAASLEILVELVNGYKGTIIIVSHDRYFLDRVATGILAIEDKQIISYNGNYSDYKQEREQKRQAQQHQYEVQQAYINKIEHQLTNLNAWSEKAHRESTKQEGFKEYHRKKAKRTDAQVKSKRKRLEQELEKHRIEAVKPEYKVQFQLPDDIKRGKRLAELKNVAKGFGQRTLFKNVNLTLQAGEKVALVGPNGSGKTTLLNILMGLEKANGTVWMSPSLNIGYLTQTVYDLPMDDTPDRFFYQPTFEMRGKVQNLMRHLGFSSEQWAQPFREMSMGERVKCKLMQFILESKDLLILDEPTNHLDLPSRERLEQTLGEYDGALLVVSHDRYFVEKITKSEWLIDNETVALPMTKTIANNSELQRLQLVNEQQEILGKLSFMTPKDPNYSALDQRFNKILKELREL